MTDYRTRCRITGAVVVILTMCAGAAFAGDQWPPKIVSNVTAGQQQLTLALQQAELALAAQGAANASLPFHLQHVINILEGKKGANYAAAQSPIAGDGFGALNYLQEAYGALKNQPGAGKLQDAIEFALAYAREAEEHALHAIRGRNPRHNAGLAVGMLSAALGLPEVDSPIRGTLAYAIKILQR
jgi:hypothetical protein